jgi:mannose-6-phosphate isomerase-like protein (cupin superfamily)
MRTFEFPKQGERFTFLKTAEETNGQRVEVAFTLTPGACGPPAHIHLKQLERFEVSAGTMIVTVSKKVLTIAAGQSLVVNAGQVHTFRNESSYAALELKATYEPGLNIEWFLTQMAELAMRNGGNFPVIESGFVLYQARDEYRLGGLAFWVQDLVFGGMAMIAKITGKSKRFQPLDSPKSFGSC